MGLAKILSSSYSDCRDYEDNEMDPPSAWVLELLSTM